VARQPFNFDPKPAFPQNKEEQKEVLSLNVIDDNVDETAAEINPEPKEELSNIQLVIKNEAPADEVTVKIGEHYLTPKEIEEKRAFEEQKRSLEERADRLRKMSFNIKGTESTDELENVPAYVRRQIDIDNGVASADKFYSGYSVGVNDQQNQSQASIQTINTFLDGKKPD
jgi:cell division protein FtsZ